MEKAHNEDYKGYEIDIFYDEDYNENPNDWGNTVLVSYHDQLYTPHDEILTKDEANAILRNEYEDADEKYNCDQIKKQYWVFGVEAYIHSGIALALINTGNFPDRQWDVSAIGVMLVPKKDYRLSKSAEKMARCEINTWNEILSGQVYGFTATSPSGNEIDACWGFIGDMKYAIEEAQGCIDWDIEKKHKAHNKQLKAYIENNVPIEKRKALSY